MQIAADAQSVRETNNDLHRLTKLAKVARNALMPLQSPVPDAI